MSVCPSWSVRLSVCPSVRLSVCPSVRLSVCPSVRLSVCPSIRLSVCPSVRLVWLMVSFDLLSCLYDRCSGLFCMIVDMSICWYWLADPYPTTSQPSASFLPFSLVRAAIHKQFTLNVPALAHVNHWFTGNTTEAETLSSWSLLPALMR